MGASLPGASVLIRTQGREGSTGLSVPAAAATTFLETLEYGRSPSLTSTPFPGVGTLTAGLASVAQPQPLPRICTPRLPGVFVKRYRRQEEGGAQARQPRGCVSVAPAIAPSTPAPAPLHSWRGPWVAVVGPCPLRGLAHGDTVDMSCTPALFRTSAHLT